VQEGVMLKLKLFNKFHNFIMIHYSNKIHSKITTYRI